MKHWLLFIFSFFSLITNGQDLQDQPLLDQLVFYSDVMVNAEDANNRLIAFDYFNLRFDEFINSVEFQSTDLSTLKWVSILQPEDQSFKLFSWQVKLMNDEYDYRAYLALKEGEIVPFKTEEISPEALTSVSLSPNEWYGCLYYNILKLSDQEYIIFGFNANGKTENRKFADVLVFDDGNISLGKEIFEDKENLGTYQNRLMLTYSSDANVNLNYNPSLKMIVHDHLITNMGRMDGQGPSNVPDGSYEGYKLIDSKWNYKEKLFDHIYEDAPRPKPILDNKKKDGKDLFGRAK